jgi:alpha-tubulin suppressor-like RCC1 family protein
MSRSFRNSSLEKKKLTRNNSRLEKESFLYIWGKPMSRKVNNRDVNLLETNNEKIIDIYPGENHTFIQKPSNFYGLGDNSFNQLSSEKKNTFSLPKIIRFKKNVIKIISGCDFSFLIDEKNGVYSFGLNIKGQLGLEHENNVAEPTLVNNLSLTTALNSTSRGLLNVEEFIVEIACGSLHTLARSNQGRIFSCGFGETYALGHGSNSNLNSFQEITHFAEKYPNKKFKIDKIEAGVSHSGIIISKTFFVWGLYGHPKNLRIAKKPIKIPLNNECRDIIMGDFLTIILTNKGEVFTMGENIAGQLGVGEIESFNTSTTPMKVNFDFPISFITAGLNHTFAISSDHEKVFAFGSNQDCQINPFDKKDFYATPTIVDFICYEQLQSLKCKGNNTYYITDTLLKTPYQNMNQDKEFISKYNLIKKELDSLSRKNKLITNENVKLKEEIHNLSIKVTESYNTEEKVDKTNYTTNDEINDVIKQFKQQLKKEKTLKPYFEIDYNEIELMHRIAEGGFGLIYKAKWRETIVAVKLLKPDLMKEETIKDFLCKIIR